MTIKEYMESENNPILKGGIKRRRKSIRRIRRKSNRKSIRRKS